VHEGFAQSEAELPRICTWESLEKSAHEHRDSQTDDGDHKPAVLAASRVGREPVLIALGTTVWENQAIAVTTG
jgi:hypothetical protein